MVLLNQALGLSGLLRTFGRTVVEDASGNCAIRQACGSFLHRSRQLRPWRKRSTKWRRHAAKAAKDAWQAAIAEQRPGVVEVVRSLSAHAGVGRVALEA